MKAVDERLKEMDIMADQLLEQLEDPILPEAVLTITIKENRCISVGIQHNMPDGPSLSIRRDLFYGSR